MADTNIGAVQSIDLIPSSLDQIPLAGTHAPSGVAAVKA